MNNKPQYNTVDIPAMVRIAADGKVNIVLQPEEEDARHASKEFFIFLQGALIGRDEPHTTKRLKFFENIYQPKLRLMRREELDVLVLIGQPYRKGDGR